MSIKRLSERVPSARFVTIAKLPNHELKFHKTGKDGSAKCDASMTNDEANIVWGVVFDINESEKPVLDLKEGLGYGYEEKSVKVIPGKGEILEVTTYYAIRINPSLKPYHWYKEHVLIGAKENSLPDSYIKKIITIESIADPTSERHKRELAIYQ